MINRACVFLFFSFFFLTQSLFAQKDGIEYSGFFDSYYFRGPVNFTLAGGLTTYQGELGKLFEKKTGYYASLGASYQVWPRTYFGGEVGYVNLVGSAGDSTGLAFSNTGIQIDAFGRFLLLDKKVTRHSQLQKRPYFIRPYIMSGVGLFYTMTSSVSYDINKYIVDPSVAEISFPKYIFTVPVGVGFQLWFSNRVSIMPEFVYHFAFSDNLDGLSLNTNKAGTDGYATLGLKVQITPQAKRVHKKKHALPPPEQYDGPKGTDYPKKIEEAPPKRYGQYNLPQEEAPQETQPDNGGFEDNTQQEDSLQDNSEEQQQEAPPAQEEQQPADDGWGW